LNGKKHGKCLEYNNDNGELKFEGIYINGMKHGKCKEFSTIYYSNDTNYIIFEGEYREGKKWNGIKNIYRDKKLISKIEYINGIKHNKYSIYAEEPFYLYKFVGQYLNGKEWNGKILNYNNNVIFEVKNGEKIMIERENKNYIGGKFNRYIKTENGKCIEFNQENCVVFEGYYFKYERWNGIGKEYNSANELIFEGEYINGKKKGKGKKYLYNELIFEGEYLYNFRLKGKSYINGILEYEGEFLYNKKYNGKGYDKNGNII